jgi:signal peptidase I
VIRTLIVQAFTIPSGSMMDTLLVGDYILVNKFLFGPEVPLTDYRLPSLRLPHRGDIIVFKYPQDEKRDFIKRVVGTPGDTVQVRGQQVLINGQALDEPYIRRNPGRAEPHGVAELLRVRLCLRAAPRSARVVLRHGGQPGQLPGLALLGLREAGQDQGQGLPDLLVMGWRSPLAALVAARELSILGRAVMSRGAAGKPFQAARQRVLSRSPRSSSTTRHAR